MATSLLPEDGKQEVPGFAPGTDSKGGSGRAARITLDIRKNFCSVNVVKHWHRLPRECPMPVSCQEAFRQSFKLRLPLKLSGSWTSWFLKVPSD